MTQDSFAARYGSELLQKVVLITNATSRLSDDLRRLGLDGAFDHVVNSSAVGAAKPDPAIFRTALAVAGVEVADALFVDAPRGRPGCS